MLKDEIWEILKLYEIHIISIIEDKPSTGLTRAQTLTCILEVVEKEKGERK